MALLSAGCGGTAQKSPSGNIRAEVFAGKEGLYYTVTHDGRTVIDTSAMGVTVDGTELFRDAALRPAGTRKIDETYSVTGRKAVSEGRCNEYLFDVTHRPSGYKYRLQTRLYDDGFAYRFVLPGDGTRTVNGEAAQWRPPTRAESGSPNGIPGGNCSPMPESGYPRRPTACTSSPGRDRCRPCRCSTEPPTNT